MIIDLAVLQKAENFWLFEQLSAFKKGLCPFETLFILKATLVFDVHYLRITVNIVG
jgi:hypothetical protein